jgi:hypothetical protein
LGGLRMMRGSVCVCVCVRERERDRESKTVVTVVATEVQRMVKPM